MPAPGDIVTLAGITRTGRNHVAAYGDRWGVLDRRDSILCRPGVPGPWLLLESAADVEAGKGQDAFLVWVREAGDVDHRIAGEYRDVR